MIECGLRYFVYASLCIGGVSCGGPPVTCRIQSCSGSKSRNRRATFRSPRLSTPARSGVDAHPHVIRFSILYRPKYAQALWSRHVTSTLLLVQSALITPPKCATSSVCLPGGGDGERQVPLIFRLQTHYLRLGLRPPGRTRRTQSRSPLSSYLGR